MSSLGSVCVCLYPSSVDSAAALHASRIATSSTQSPMYLDVNRSSLPRRDPRRIVIMKCDLVRSDLSVKRTHAPSTSWRRMFQSGGGSADLL